MSCIQVKSALGSKGQLEKVWDGTLHHIDDLPFNPNMNDMPDVFTPFRNKASPLNSIANSNFDEGTTNVVGLMKNVYHALRGMF